MLEEEEEFLTSGEESFERDSSSASNEVLTSTTPRRRRTLDSIELIGYQPVDHGQWQGREFVHRMNQIDVLGMEVDCEPLSQMPKEYTTTVENISLWQTFKILYNSNPMVKSCILGLLILLIASGTIIGLVVSQSNKSNEDCADSYTSVPFILFPEKSENAWAAGGFGISISASSEYLVVGAPYPKCNSQLFSCENFVQGGGAYLYRRNHKNQWSLESSFLLNDETSDGDEFGQSVAISEDSTTVVIGAPKDDKLGVVSGAIYVVEQPFTTPTRLLSNDIGFNDRFGGSVSASSYLSVTNIVAGASHDDDNGSNSGGVYVFTKFDDAPPPTACGIDTNVEVGTWLQCRKLLPDDAESNDQFGRAVDISERTIVVGAMWDDDLGIDSGAAYVFRLGDDGDWSFQQKLLPQRKLLPISFESFQGDRFGISVATSGERIVVGADLNDYQGIDSGAAYVFRLSKGVWVFESKLPSVTTEDRSGYSCGFRVDISKDGNLVIIGCPEAPGGGAAYTYNRQEDGRWVEVQKVISQDNTRADLHLGGSVAISGEMTVVGFGRPNGDIFSYQKNHC